MSDIVRVQFVGGPIDGEFDECPNVPGHAVIVPAMRVSGIDQSGQPILLVESSKYIFDGSALKFEGQI